MAARSISASARQVSPDAMIWAAMAIFLSARLASSFHPSVYRQNAPGMHAGHLGFLDANGCPIDRIGNDRNDEPRGVPWARPLSSQSAQRRVRSGPAVEFSISYAMVARAHDRTAGCTGARFAAEAARTRPPAGRSASASSQGPDRVLGRQQARY
jgi:hypothetical protein